MASFKGAHFAQDIMLTCVRWYLAYPLSDRHLEELIRNEAWRSITRPSTGAS
jgi:putative transposase